ncbi:MAG: TolC family outer membrane protein [Pseudomonadales bacterium]|nr:TolC family outer membrane protein [Pseudomonadales bacterium]
MPYASLMSLAKRYLAMLSCGLTCFAINPWAQAANLVDIYELALINDPTLQAAQANFNASQEIKAKAISQLLPQISAKASYTETDEDSNSKSYFGNFDITSFPGGTAESRTRTESDNRNYSISLSQNLFNLSAYFTFQQSRALSRQGELQLAIDQQALIIRTANAYFDVLRGQDNLTSALAEEKAIQQQLEQTQQRYDVGLIAITDVYESRAAFDLAVANRLTEEVSLGIAYEGLTALTGQAHTNLANLAASFATNKPSPNKAEDWVAFAAENNLSIKLAEQVAEASNQNAKAKKAATAPSLKATLRYNDNEQDADNTNLVTEDEQSSFSNRDGTTAEITLDLPIWAGGLKQAERREAGFQRVRDQAKLIAAKRSAFRDARSSFLTTVADTARVNARKLAITSAESALDATEAGYDAGTRNIVDLLNAQRDLFRAQRDYANTRYDFIINSLGLKRAAGILGPSDIYELNNWLIEPEISLQSSQP